MSILLNEGQRELTLYLLEIFLKPEQLKGADIWITPHYKIIISQACNGVIPILFLFASILAYPSTVGQKLFWMVLGVIFCGKCISYFTGCVFYADRRRAQRLLLVT